MRISNLLFTTGFFGLLVSAESVAHNYLHTDGQPLQTVQGSVQYYEPIVLDKNRVIRAWSERPVKKMEGTYFFKMFENGEEVDLTHHFPDFDSSQYGRYQFWSARLHQIEEAIALLEKKSAEEVDELRREAELAAELARLAAEEAQALKETTGNVDGVVKERKDQEPIASGGPH